LSEEEAPTLRFHSSPSPLLLDDADPLDVELQLHPAATTATTTSAATTSGPAALDPGVAGERNTVVWRWRNEDLEVAPRTGAHVAEHLVDRRRGDSAGRIEPFHFHVDIGGRTAPAIADVATHGGLSFVFAVFPVDREVFFAVDHPEILSRRARHRAHKCHHEGEAGCPRTHPRHVLPLSSAILMPPSFGQEKSASLR